MYDDFKLKKPFGLHGLHGSFSALTFLKVEHVKRCVNSGELDASSIMHFEYTSASNRNPCLTYPELWIRWQHMNGSEVKWSKSKILFFFCLCHFGKVKYIGNNILKYLSHSFKIARLIKQNFLFPFKIDTFLQWWSDPSPTVYIGTFNLDQFTSVTYVKWLLKCYKTPLLWICLCFANHYQIFTGARWWDTRQFLY